MQDVTMLRTHTTVVPIGIYQARCVCEVRYMRPLADAMATCYHMAA